MSDFLLYFLPCVVVCVGLVRIGNRFKWFVSILAFMNRNIQLKDEKRRPLVNLIITFVSLALLTILVSFVCEDLLRLPYSAGRAADGAALGVGLAFIMGMQINMPSGKK